MIHAGIPYTSLQGHEANDVPTFWLLLYVTYGVSGFRVQASGILDRGFRVQLLGIEVAPFLY